MSNASTCISTEDVSHYIFQTPKAFLHNYNSALNPPQPPFTIFFLRLFILFQDEILLIKHPPHGHWSVPTYGQTNLDNYTDTIATRSYQSLVKTGVLLQEPQIMEPAFSEYTVEGHETATGEKGLFLSVLITVVAKPSWPPGSPEGALMVSFDTHEGYKVAEPNHIAQVMIPRSKTFSLAHLLERFPEKKDFLHMRMCFLSSYIAFWKLRSRGLLHFHLIVMREESSSGYFLFRTREEVLKKLADEPVGRVYKIDEEMFSLRGASFWKGGRIETQLCVLGRDRMEDAFEKNGRMSITWIEESVVERLQMLIMRGGVEESIV